MESRVGVGLINSFHAMCGLPGSGKTTLSEQLSEEYNALLYCYDKISKGSYSHAIRLEIYNNTLENLRLGQNVIYDDLLLIKKMRKELLNILSQVNCYKVLHVMKTPIDVCFERLQKRDRYGFSMEALKSFYRVYEPPTLEEGWDEIIYHNYIKEV